MTGNVGTLLCMTVEDWWSTLLNGAVGSVVGLIGAFGAFFLTARHDKRRDQISREEAERAERNRRTLAGIAEVAIVSNRFRLSSGFNKDERLEEFSEALMRLSASESYDHPHASRWLQYQASEVLDLCGPDVDMRAAPWQAGHIIAMLQRWAEEGLPANFFPEVDHTRKNIKRETSEIVEHFRKEDIPMTMRNISEYFRNLNSGND